MAKDPIMTKESFEHMQDIIETAGVLETRAPYEKLVNTKFAEKSVEEIK